VPLHVAYPSPAIVSTAQSPDGGAPLPDTFRFALHLAERRNLGDCVPQTLLPHKGPSTPNRTPCLISPPESSLHLAGPPRPEPRSIVPSSGAGRSPNVVARGGRVDVGGPCGCQASTRRLMRRPKSAGREASQAECLLHLVASYPQESLASSCRPPIYRGIFLLLDPFTPGVPYCRKYNRNILLANGVQSGRR
jgi:hypothetical protein